MVSPQNRLENCWFVTSLLVYYRDYRVSPFCSFDMSGHRRLRPRRDLTHWLNAGRRGARRLRAKWHQRLRRQRLARHHQLALWFFWHNFCHQRTGPGGDRINLKQTPNCPQLQNHSLANIDRASNRYPQSHHHKGPNTSRTFLLAAVKTSGHDWPDGL